MMHTTDGGDSWSQQTTGTTARFAGIDFIDSENGWAVGISGTILHTTDGGQNWSSQIQGTSELFHAVDFIDLDNGWVTGRNGTILKTTDGGNNWYQQNTRTWYDVSSVCFLDVNNGWVSGDYGLIMATNNGGGIVSVEHNETTSSLPETFFLLQNYPNPFNPSTTIRWEQAEAGYVTINIYDVLGKEVITLVNKELNPGRHETVFDASRFSSGVYFYQLRVYPANGEAGEYTAVRKMIFIK
jgi:hypothetical protein